MKTVVTFIALSLALPGCAERIDVPSGEGEPLTRIDSEAAFRSQVVGRTISLAGDENTAVSTVVRSDGTWSGIFRGKQVSGKWWWEDDYLCRSLIMDGTREPDNCGVWSVSQNKLRIVHDRGTGPSSDYSLI